MSMPINAGDDPMRYIQELSYRIDGASGSISGGGQAITQTGRAPQLPPGRAINSPDELSKTYGRDQLRLSEEALELKAGGARDQQFYSPAVLALKDTLQNGINAGKDNPQKDRNSEFFSMLKGSKENEGPRSGRTGEKPSAQAEKPQEKGAGSGTFKELVMGLLSKAMNGEEEVEGDPEAPAQAKEKGEKSRTAESGEPGLPTFLTEGAASHGTMPTLPQSSKDDFSFDSAWVRNRILTLHRD
jgi:hypothetical protein